MPPLSGARADGVALPDGGLLQIRPGVDEDLVGCHGLSLTRKVGHQLLNLALYLATHRPETAVILVTKNVNLRLKADALGIFAEDYEVGRRAEALTEQYMGWHRVDVSAEFVDAFYANGKASLEIPEAAPGEYAILMVDGKPQAAGKWEMEASTPRKHRMTGSVGLRREILNSNAQSMPYSMTRSSWSR